MISKKILGDKFTIENSTPKFAKQQEELQRIVYPTLADEERIKNYHFLNHIKLFPEGQFLVRDGDKVIGSCSTLRTHFSTKDHTFLEIADNLWMNNNEPNGDWLYGIDMCVHPDYRKIGVARALYDERKNITRILGCKGILIGGMANGFIFYESKMSVQEYCEKLRSGEITDQTIEPQMKCGFKWIKPIFGYINDPQCGYAGILMYWPVDPNLKINI